MAHLVINEEDYIRRYGPSLNYTPESGWKTEQADRLVKTHCCFCGVQCGIQLKVKNDRIIGFEPWEEFPVNQGKLCPKGIKRYLQNEHPDRLKNPLIRCESGFRSAEWEEAMERTVTAIQSIQSRYGKDAFAFLGGASMTNEKAYLNGKFARLALETSNIDYNGRLCMVSAGAANKMAFGIDRSANPWSDIPKAEVVLLAGTNLSECFPVLTEHVWKARDNGGKIIVIDPRMTPIARTCDLFLPVRPGTDSALVNGILHIMILEGWVDEDFIRNHTNGFDRVRESVHSWTPARTQQVTGVPAANIVKAAELWGNARTSILLHARGIEHHTNGVDNVLNYINLVLTTGRIGREGCGYGTITGQGNGQGGREHGQRCNQLPGGRDINDAKHRNEIADFWGVSESELPGEGLTACEIIDAIEDGKIKGLLSISFNPLVSIPDSRRTKAALEKLEFFACIDFFLSETGRHADVIFAGSLQAEDEGTVTTGEGRCIHLPNSIPPPGNARVDWKIICELAERLGKGQFFDFRKSEEIFTELCAASKGGPIDYSGMNYQKLEEDFGIFWPCPNSNHSGTPRLFEDRCFFFPDGKARFHGIDHRGPAEEVDADYPIYLTTGRVVSQYLSGNQTRRIGDLVDQYPKPLCEMHPKLADRLGILDAEEIRVVTRRGTMLVPAQIVRTIRPDTVFIPYHWPGKQSANQLTNRVLDPISKIPEFKVCACRLEKIHDEPKKEVPS
ncbi:MAG TPA: nitrite reductase [Verrucomicrobiales bacterium]|nr:nitrite reductase [Verrucomicrobiales bacterium]